MRVELNVFVHASNGMDLQIIPETDFEAAFLEAFAKSDAKFEASGHPGKAAIGRCGYRIKATRGGIKHE